jgi:hypothetical protein
MASTTTIKSDLDKKYSKVNETPAGYRFFVTLHDFVKYVESIPSFETFFGEPKTAAAKKASRTDEISAKYSILKQVYQGIEDIDLRTTDDLGHDRYVAIRELGLIRKNDLSENNSFWKRRETLRKLVGEIHKTLAEFLAEEK